MIVSSNIPLPRFRPNGGADRSFGGSGLITLSTRFEGAHGIAVAGDNSVWVAGDARHRGKDRISSLMRSPISALMADRIRA